VNAFSKALESFLVPSQHPVLNLPRLARPHIRISPINRYTMFKKQFNLKALSPLRSSDRRKLADGIISEYSLQPASSTSPDDQTPEQKAEATAAHTALRASLLPDNTQSARFTTTQGPDLKQASGALYVGSHDGEEARILWFQIEGRIYPTVYTLWRNADIVPLLHTPEIAVKKLQGGADLMTPGLAGGPPFPERAKKGAVVAIASTERPSVPVAVGWCEIDVSALEQVRGAKGHAVRNMHWAGDEAWAYGVSGKSAVAAPEQIEAWVKVLETRGLAQKAEALDIDDQEVDGGVALTEAERGDTNGQAINTEDAADEAAPAAPDLSQKEIDEAFWNAFLYGVHKHKTTNPETKNYGLVFPLSQSFVMSNLVQPFLPAFTPEQSQQLQIKKSSWKNIKKFIKALDKEKIIKSKEKDGNETTILDIDFDDAAILDFTPYRLPKKETMAGGSQRRGENANEQIDAGDTSVGQKLQILSFFKPTSKLQPLFASATKQLLTPPEVREIVTSYIEAENLISETNKRLVKLDPILSNAVFDGSGKLDKEVLTKGTVPRDALIDRVLHAMATSHAILRNGNDPSMVTAKSGAPPKVHITLETRSGNKTVTKVSGLEPYFINPRLLADELRKACAGSTSVEPLAGAAKKNEKPVEEVMVQGPQKDAVVKALERRGVDKRWVEVLDKTKGKKR
jgi:translation initiation factor 2D